MNKEFLDRLLNGIFRPAQHDNNNNKNENESEKKLSTIISIYDVLVIIIKKNLFRFHLFL